MTQESIDLHTTPPEHAEAGGCQCGHEESEQIVLDVREIPHAIRHATVFGALDVIAPGFSMDLVAPHDPVPLLAQVDQMYPGRFAVAYLQKGPEAWTLRFTRQSAS